MGFNGFLWEKMPKSGGGILTSLLGYNKMVTRHKILCKIEY